MCVPSLNEIYRGIFELSCTQVKTFGSNVMEVKPVYPDLCSGDIIKYIQTELLGFYTLTYIINIFTYALPFNENEKNDKRPKCHVVQKLLSCCMSLSGTSNLRSK